MDIRIRSETPSDAQAIERVTIEAFLNAPHTSHTEQFIIRELRKAGQLTVSLVAEADGEVVGHAAASPVTISGGAGGWYGLGPVSVAPQYQGRAIGHRLVERLLAELRSRGAAGCVVVGEPSYYGRFGFKAEPSLILPDVPPEYFQAIVFHGSAPAGVVSFHAAFDAQA